MSRPILIRAAIVITMDDALDVLAPGDVLVEGTRIAPIAPSLRVEDAEIVEAARHHRHQPHRS